MWCSGATPRERTWVWGKREYIGSLPLHSASLTLACRGVPGCRSGLNVYRSSSCLSLVQSKLHHLAIYCQLSVKMPVIVVFMLIVFFLCIWNSHFLCTVNKLIPWTTFPNCGRWYKWNFGDLKWRNLLIVFFFWQGLSTYIAIKKIN